MSHLTWHVPLVKFKMNLGAIHIHEVFLYGYALQQRVELAFL